ncbi:23S rRNA (uracil(1939)-C(5))-methyltransferase RlmD [Enterococcus sp. LJL120]
MKEYPVEKNQQIIVEITDLTHEGLGVAKIDGYPIFIENALIGEEVKALVVKVGNKFGYGKVLELLTESPDRQPLDNLDLLRTGIAPLGHLKYEKQLLFKQQQIEKDLTRIAKLPEVPVLPTIGMANPVGYRNKAQVPVRKIDGQLEIGFYRKNSHDVVPIEDFVIQDPKIDEALQTIKAILRRFNVKPYNETDNSGFLRNIIIRRGHYSHEMMVTLVTRLEKFFKGKELAEQIAKELPEVVSVIQNVNEKVTNVILGDKEILLYGKHYIEDQLLDNKFAISSRSFYQVNTLQTEFLYQTAFDFAGLTKEDVVVDAYSGIGTIGLSLAKRVGHVYGVEVIAEAVADAKMNALLNDIDNADYKLGSAEKRMAKWVADGIKPSVVFVDPPRKGLTNSLIDSIAESDPSRVIYISCNPATLARDLKLFADLGYQAEKIQPVDLFPQTYHIESVTLLTKRA